MADDREPNGRIAHGIYRDWLAEQVLRAHGDEVQLGSWEDLTKGMREAYMRIGSAVAAQAVHDAGLENIRRDARLFALRCHLPAVLDALRYALSRTEHVDYDPDYLAAAKRYKAALQALGGGEEGDERGD